LHDGSPANAGLSSIPSHLIAPWKWPEVYFGPQSCRSEMPRARSLSTLPKRSVTALWIGSRQAKRSPRLATVVPRLRGVVSIKRNAHTPSVRSRG